MYSLNMQISDQYAITIVVTIRREGDTIEP